MIYIDCFGNRISDKNCLHLRHLEFFEMVRVNDEKELAKRYDEVHVDTKSSQVSSPSFRSIH